MNNKQLTTLALKLFTIYVLAQALLSIPLLATSLTYLRNGPAGISKDMWLWLLALAAILITFILAIVLWRFAGKVMAASGAEEKLSVPEGLEPLILAALGIFLSVQALVRLTGLSAGAYMQASQHATATVSLETTAALLAYLFQLLVGVSLVLRASGWVALLRRIRSAGLSGKDV